MMMTAIAVVDSKGLNQLLFCSIDSRHGPLSKGTHWASPEIFGARAQFVITSNSSFLRLSEVASADEGSYRCRVDHNKAPAVNTRLNLIVLGKNLKQKVSVSECFGN